MCIYTLCTDKLLHCNDSLHPCACTCPAGRQEGTWQVFIAGPPSSCWSLRCSPLSGVLFLLAVQPLAANTCRILFNCCPRRSCLTASVQAALAHGLTCSSGQLLGLCWPFNNTETLAFPSPSASRESIGTRTPTHRCVRLSPRVFTVYPFFFRNHTRNVLLSELSLPVTLQWRSLLSEASSGCLIIAPLQAVHHRVVARQQHQQAGLWVAEEGEEEDAAHICREEELTFPWEREVWELPSLCLSDGIPACSIMKVTGISEIADRCLGGKKDARSLLHGRGVQSWVSFSQLWGPWSNSLPHRWDGRSLPSCPGHSHRHRLGDQTARINHIHSLNNFKMSYFGVDDKFLEIWKDHMSAYKIENKMEGNTRLETFHPKDELENIFIYFCFFFFFFSRIHKWSFVIETNTHLHQSILQLQ